MLALEGSACTRHCLTHLPSYHQALQGWNAVVKQQHKFEQMRMPRRSSRTICRCRRHRAGYKIFNDKKVVDPLTHCVAGRTWLGYKLTWAVLLAGCSSNDGCPGLRP